ncbi:MAG TPA: aminotransferase class V-fold PLP-dependent enzyme [Kofleriaceae bacterium]|nr:aminotransferase class V-fold PLP-dependent enzyme [Kofleriaceae bacterium]
MTLTLFTPGPVEIPAIVTQHLIDPPCNYHRQDEFKAMFAANQRDLKALVGLARPDDYSVTFLLASGTGTNEACLRALAALGPGVIIENGFFGQRLVEQARRSAIDHVVYRAPHDRPLDVARLDEFLAGHRALRWAYVVSHETRATLRNPLTAIAQVCKRRGLRVGADCVSSAFAYALSLEAAGVDLAVATTSKALMAVPGLGIVFARNDAMAELRTAARGDTYYLDLVGEHDKQAKELAPRFGQPVQLHAAVRGACLHLRGVGIDAHMRRIREQLAHVTRHLASLGVEALLAPEHRGWVAGNFLLPPGMLYPELTQRMAAQGFYILYGAIEDPRQFQVCTMGHLTAADVDGVEAAFTRVLAGAQRAVA